jgi:hypothetical protein
MTKNTARPCLTRARGSSPSLSLSLSLCVCVCACVCVCVQGEMRSPPSQGSAANDDREPVGW